VHPGRWGRVEIAAPDGAVIDAGWFGELHPSVARDRSIKGVAVVAELDVDAIVAAVAPVTTFQPFSSYPPVREDLAFVLEDSVRAGDVIDTVREAGGELLEHVHPFDRYVGEPIPAGSHSLALRLSFRSNEGTLTDEEVTALRGKIVEAVAAAHKGVLRDAG
jgi:phenylalanyl-tRNA synthetase beta chain